jgi:hypothetical protein
LENGRSVGELSTDNSRDVFQKDNCWLALPDSCTDEWVEVPFIGYSLSAPSNTERLAGEASREDVHLSTKLSEWECLNIRPDRCWIYLSLFSLRDQVRDGPCFPLHMSDFSETWENSSESKPNSFVSRTDG